MSNINSEVYGDWIVTTEGDCEGKSIKNLGTHKGFIDEIAFALADKCAYSLHFTRQNLISLDLTPKRDIVCISGIGSVVKQVQKKFDGRKVFVENSTFYDSVTLKRERPLTPEQKMINRLKDAGFDPREVINTFKQR